jgi:hypothetical protein
VKPISTIDRSGRGPAVKAWAISIRAAAQTVMVTCATGGLSKMQHNSNNALS